MPPNRLAATLATPRPLHSRFFELGVSVRLSTTLAVIIDSSRPTIAMASAGSAIRRSVSSVKGTSSHANTGRASGNWPRSATVCSGRPNHDAIAVSTTMQISGEGMARVRRGSR